jgi:DNA-binding NarL/FixJ family response regulator
MRLMIIDDHPLVRRGLISMLKGEANIDEIKEAANLQESICKVSKEKPDVAIVDLRLGYDDGLEVILNGKKVSPETKFIILTSFISREDFLKAEQLGVDGYVLKDALFEDILYAIKSVNRGKKYYDPGIINYKGERKGSVIIDQLTERERDVLKVLGQGCSNDEIAKHLFISENTVKKHVSNILSKLNIKHRTQAVVFYNNNFSL